MSRNFDLGVPNIFSEMYNSVSAVHKKNTYNCKNATMWNNRVRFHWYSADTGPVLAYCVMFIGLLLAFGGFDKCTHSSMPQNQWIKSLLSLRTISLKDKTNQNKPITTLYIILFIIFQQTHIPMRSSYQINREKQRNFSLFSGEDSQAYARHPSNQTATE